MGIEFAIQCRNRILECLTAALQKIEVSNHWFLIYPLPNEIDTLDTIPPRNLSRQLEDYIGEFPLAKFLTGALSRDLQIGRPYNSDVPNAPLSEVPGFENLAEVVERYVAEIERLPYDYIFTFPLSPFVGNAARPLGSRIALSESHSIAFADDDFRKKFPLGDLEQKNAMTNLLKLSTMSPHNWSDSIPYLQIRKSGFVGRYTVTTPQRDAISDLRSFCGLAFAERVLQLATTYVTNEPTVYYYTHMVDGDLMRYIEAIELTRTVAQTVGKLIPDDLDGYIKADLSGWLAQGFKNIGSIFDQRQRSSNVLLGAQWLFDSYSAEEPMQAYIAASVVAEILLGDKATSDKTGLTDLLANRCAYLISGTQPERESILKDFKDIYEVRSRIVHQGKRTISQEEREKLHTLQWMDSRIIQEESKMIRREKKKEQEPSL